MLGSDEDPFLGLPTASDPSLLAEDDDRDTVGTKPDEGAAAGAEAMLSTAAAVEADAGDDQGATDESHLPAWMRRGHASIIRPSTPAASARLHAASISSAPSSTVLARIHSTTAAWSAFLAPSSSTCDRPS